MKRTFRMMVSATIALIAACVLHGASFAASTNANMVFILDASGSMWGQVEGKAKMAIAKEVMKGLVEDLPDGMNVGLVAYGHRKKGDCKDVEELVALTPVDKKGVVAKVNAISPKGMTPITLSITETVKPLKSREGETTVVLVSDGKETCEGDPCALVKELKASGVKFTMHVVGFDVTPEETKQLECIAKAGGGEYFAAKNAGEFKKAAEKVVEKAKPTGELRVTAVRNGKPIPGHIEVYRAGAEERLLYNDTVQIKTDAGTELAPGNYDVKVIDSKTAGKPSVMLKGVAIERGAVVEKSADFSGGKVVVGVTSNGEKVTGWLYAMDPVTGKRVTSTDTSVNNPQTVNLQPGTYDIKVQYNKLPGKPTKEFKGVVIDNGTIVEKAVDFSEGYIEITVLTNGEKDYTRYGREAFASYEIKDAVTGKRVDSGDTSAHNPDKSFVSPGTYTIVVKSERVRGDPKVTFENVVVERGATAARTAEFKRGHLEVGVTKGGEKVTGYIHVYKSGTEKRVDSGDTSAHNPDRYTLLPGKYDIVVKDKTDQTIQKKFDGVVVDAAATKTVMASF